MEVPKKIYIDVQDNLDDSFLYGFIEKSGDEDIEYIRTDVFIEKACDAYCKICGHFAHTTPTHICRRDCIYYSDFVKQLKEL